MSTVEVHDLNADSIGEQVSELHALSQFGPLEDDTLELTFSLRVPADPMAGAVFAQTMLGLRHDLRLVVTLPDSQTAITSLIRTGVASALARRREWVSYHPPANPITQHDLWHTWTPGARDAMAPMFETDERPDSLFGPRHAVFVNPHLTTEPEGTANITRLVDRWLTQMVMPGLNPDQHERYVLAPVFTVDQLVRNVREHAITPTHPRDVDSVVVLEAISHGLHSYLRITVLDTGPGVVSTLRPKLTDPYGPMTDAELLHKLLEGELPGWDRGRGFGLATIAELVSGEADASLELWTGRSKVRVDNSVAPIGAAVEVSGTVINAFFPLPS
jgi:hypothetical protein